MEVSSDSLYVVVSDMNTLYDYFLEGETESSTCKCLIKAKEDVLHI